MKIFDLMDIISVCRKNGEVKFAFFDSGSTKRYEEVGKVVGVVYEEGDIVILCEEYAGVDGALSNAFDRSGPLGESVHQSERKKEMEI